MLNERLTATQGSAVSAASYLETGIVLDRMVEPGSAKPSDDYPESAGVEVQG